MSDSGELGSKTPSYIGDPKNLIRPFGEYLIYSNQTFSMHEVKQLWALHDCVGKNKRLFTMRVDDIEHGPARTKSLCDDWTTLADTVLWFKGTLDTVALQLLLKNENAAMRRAAATVLGNPSSPSSRPNTFGELLQAFVRPSPDIEAAVEWALKGGPAPDFSLHLRLRHNRSHEAPAAAAACILRTIQENQQIVRFVCCNILFFVHVDKTDGRAYMLLQASLILVTCLRLCPYQDVFYPVCVLGDEGLRAVIMKL